MQRTHSRLSMLSLPFHHVLLNLETRGGVGAYRGIVLANLVFPGADHGEVGPRRGGHAIVRAGGTLDFELVGKRRPVHLVLMLVRQVVAQLHGIEAGPFAARLAHATGGGAHGRTRPAQVETGRRQFLEGGFQFVGFGSEENDVASGPVEVGEPGAVPFPDIGNGPQGIAGVKPAGGVIDAQCVEVRDLRKLFGRVAVAADHARTVAANADHASVLPVALLLRIGEFQLSQEIFARRISFPRLVDFRNKAGPRSHFQVIQQRCSAGVLVCHIF
jgi:hypothetical protein